MKTNKIQKIRELLNNPVKQKTLTIIRNVLYYDCGELKTKEVSRRTINI
jgi:hypothetical protein